MSSAARPRGPSPLPTVPPPVYFSQISAVGLAGASLLVAVGTYWAFERGAPDFSVFHGAWKLVLEGRGREIYSLTALPDRFLYAPGFAWVLSPLGWLPRGIALALWCFAKAAAVGYLVASFRPRSLPRAISMGIAGWGIAIFARSLLIDFQYGQVNLLIVGACSWALLRYFTGQASGPGRDFLAWFLLAAAALAKIFPLPLALVPWIMPGAVSVRRRQASCLGVVSGFSLIFLAPAVTEGWAGAWNLLHEWKGALLSKGLPLESHNQSFTAFLHHYFSGEVTHVVALGPGAIPLGHPWLAGGTIGLLSLAWMFLMTGFLFAWLLQSDAGQRRAPISWIAVLLAAVILPSHLVWKPYFVMAIPLSIIAIGRAATLDTGPRGWLFLAALFAIINLSGFDVLGPHWGAQAEAASLLLWAELALIAYVVRSTRAWS